MSKNRKVKRPSRDTSTGRMPAPQQARRPVVKREPQDSGRNREITGVVCLGIAIFLIASLLSLQFGSGTLMGPFGRTIATVVYGLWGVCSYIVTAMLAVAAVRMLVDRRPVIRLHEAAGLILGLISLGALIHLAASGYRVAGHSPGGMIGEHVAEVFRALISTAGTVLLALTGLLVAAVIGTPLSMPQVVAFVAAAGSFVWAGVARVGVELGRFSGEVVRAVLPERDRDQYLDEDEEEEAEPYDAFALEGTDPGTLDPPIIEVAREQGVPMTEMADDTERLDDEAVAERLGALNAETAAGHGKARTPDKGDKGDKSDKGKKAAAAGGKPEARIDAKPDAKVDAKPEVKREAKKVVELPEVGDLDDIDDEISQDVSAAEEAVDMALGGNESVPASAGKKKEKAVVVEEAAGEAGHAPVIVESQFRQRGASAIREQEKKPEGERLDFIPLHKGEYKLPPLSLLDYDESQQSTIDRTAMLELSARLTKTLENYGVKGEVVAIRPGPVVTMYEFAPAPGTRVSKISNLSDDLAMALEAMSVRIVAPIPGKAAVGIEVPNKSRETVYLKEVLVDESFQRGKHKLPLAVGKDIEGAPSLVDLAKMPHLLVAGTTGSGKSVSVNSMITSLLFSCTPEDVRMIMVDPKMLELSIYEGIPHLLLPVVTDPKKANLALRWGVEEMDRRYDLLATMGVRDLATYNKKAAKLRAQYEADKLRLAAEDAQRLADDDDEVETTEERDGTLGASRLEAPPQHLPYIVIIIDEFADLMMCAPKEVETSVARIAQKARAAGIHLVLATQRPSVDVITGLIKANFPSRAAFRVASKVDSRTILDQGGAEALLGSGDMLFSDRGASPCRYHGCFVGEEEIGRVVDFLKQQAKPVYNMEILKPRDEGEDEERGGEGGDGGEPMDEMYDRAVSLVAETRQASISMIQRRLRVGYNRAARMVEQMEREGVVSAPDHTNKREVLIQPAA